MMNTNPTYEVFQTTSQRVAATYRRMLSEFCPALPTGLDEGQQAEMQAAQAELHAFFQTLYKELSDAPDQFGLPAVEDIYLVIDHSKEGPDKAEVKRALDRQRKLVEDGLSFLSGFAREASSDGAVLKLAAGHPVADFLKKKSGQAWARGLQLAGLVLTPGGGMICAENPRFPRMMPALKLLAESSARCPDANVGGVFFARCDFRAIRQEFGTAALELYRAFAPAEFAWATRMHAYFAERGYQPLTECNRLFGWTVKYQGKKSIKGTPLFQVGFDDRYRQPMRVQIKCASAQRVVPLLAGQSQALRDDFARRVFNCGNCHWCDQQKKLGPYEFEHRGVTRQVCWYVLPDLDEFSDETADLVQEYEQLHAKLG